MSDSGPGRREVAYRLFAAEFDDAKFSYSESDEERAPNYVVTPTGARVNRLFAVGVLTEVEDVNPEMVRGRVVDPTGPFVTYAGQYQPEALAFLERAEPPSFVALSGKARTFQPEDGDRIYTSVRPESINEVDAETRDRWVVTTAERTIERVGIMAAAIEAGLAGDQLRAALIEEGVDERLADGIALALDYYNTTPAYLSALRETALDALRVVAGERDEVGRLDIAPDEGMGDASELATLDLSNVPSPETAAAAAGVDEDAETASTEQSTEEPAEVEQETESTEEMSDAVSEETTEEPAGGTEPEIESGAEPEAEPESQPVEETVETSDDAESTAVSEKPTESEPDAEPEPEPDADSDPGEPGDFEADEDLQEEVEEEIGDFDPDEFDLDDEVREEVEEEYGTEFSTADEVEEPDIETSDSEAESTPEVDTEAASAETGAEEESTEAEDSGGPAEPAAEADLEDAVMATMEELDDGDGADKGALVDAVVEEYGVEADEVEEAIQDALMSGQCYEPSDGTLKSI